ncbi:MAG: hypothetical protein GY795_35745, partial [Desulfobacterales bacterium]|nr:hypothetical protein [Desulfobacterales bacterium]
VSGNYAYLACGDGLKVINISNPASPSLTGSYDSPKIGDVSMPAYDVHVSGNYAYVVFAADGLRIIDISNPASPSPTGHYNNVLIAKSVHVSGNYAYLTNPGHDDGDLLIIDISNPASPSLAGSYYAPGFVTDAYVSGSCVYVTDPLFGVNNSGLQVVDISNPATPAYTDSYKLSMNSDVYVSGNHTYLANDFGRLVILDLGKSGSESGSVKVTISPQGAVDAGAQWQADGGAWQNSGTVVSDLSAGSHTVSFKTVGDWTAPPDQTVTVSSEQTASVTGTYTEIVQTGSLKVTISPQDAIDAGAQWQADSGAWQNSGTAVSDLSAGSHTVSFKTVGDWTAPPDQTVNVGSEQTVNVTGTYTEIVQTGSLKVTISPQGASDAGAQWQADSGAWQDSGAVVPDLGVGTHTVTFKTTDGWTAPPDQTVNVGSGQTVNVTGTYTEIVQTGSLKVTISPQGATDAGAQWQTDSGSWQDSGTVVSDLDVGTYTVFFKTADGWTAPPDQTVSISADVTEAISGTYTKETYTLADAIVILQMLCSVAPNNSEGYKDANSDGKAGLEDVAYILQSVLEVR